MICSASLAMTMTSANLLTSQTSPLGFLRHLTGAPPRVITAFGEVLAGPEERVSWLTIADWLRSAPCQPGGLRFA
jgi:hypothetical protein